MDYYLKELLNLKKNQKLNGNIFSEEIISESVTKDMDIYLFLCLLLLRDKNMIPSTFKPFKSILEIQVITILSNFLHVFGKGDMKPSKLSKKL